MKKLILWMVVGFAAWNIYTQQQVPVITNADLVLLDAPIKKASKLQSIITQQYTCDGRQHCSQMSSCAEATFFINNCPNTKMDGDNDGIPCERQHCN
ncbi:MULTISPECIES: excalibur calcium-binding domain-containing protein [unclassified Agarivorans]|uniref:excalibur calcium-binding domain-containing protein n=1 Tax=unclassified Agarivorans TaxID=2636026 RepID=UPI0026E3C1FA|nr:MULTISPECIES: excalibur calcium-binding domain-containing protein [unclassified Agarivorans]MDO6683918.1 excalibur calcium-binding domain-containing protein [Agarivorans sp. 3_MG-2023]MDO6714349.1 excalibur calcium-binding domain-containing protein [Agarivorans sp. 2_MG-2023]